MAKAQTIQESRWVGRLLRDKWRIERRIARGGMGQVFAATHKNNGSTAAIKILHAEFSRDPDTRSRFLQEGYAANQVNHPGVVRILDDDVTEEGLAYLVMELLEGELLEQRRIRKGGTLPLTEVYELGDQLLDVLAAAHAKEIVHRDIKPDNIFLTKEGRLKVLDFGFAQMKSSFRSERTATGFLLGTPGFMAPEQAIGNRPLIDAQTDLWAVGATLFLLLTGDPVHYGESAAEMLIAAANYQARSVATLDPHLPPMLITTVDRALAFDKAERWPDARAMQLALRGVASSASAPATNRGQWGRSIVDYGELHGADAEDRTMMDPGIVKIDDDEPSASAKTKAFTPIADLTPDSDSGALEPPTVAKPSPATEPSGADFNGSTVIMGVRPHPGAPPPAHPPVSSDQLPPAQVAARHGTPAATYPPAVRESNPQLYGAYDAAPQVPVSQRRASTGSNVLTLFLIGGITMVVVILTGLLVILGSD